MVTLLLVGVGCGATGFVVGLAIGSAWEAQRWRRIWEQRQKPVIEGNLVDDRSEIGGSSFTTEDAARVRRRVEEARKQAVDRRRTL